MIDLVYCCVYSPGGAYKSKCSPLWLFADFPSTVTTFTVAMDNCPPEILLHIFRLACDDDGSTGRALSLVCRSVHNLSKELKYQSIAIVGLPRLVAFAAMLQDLPEPSRRIRHLFFSSMAQNASGAPKRITEEIQNYVSPTPH